MKYEGNMLKMQVKVQNPLQYYLPVGNDKIHLNPLIGKEIKLTFRDKINCIHCGDETTKSFHQGFCYSCFISVPQTDEGVLKPEKDKSHLGVSRDMEWAKKNTLIDHYVYLSVTSNLKVGVTRHTQIPERWIDQGAISAIKIAKTPYRQLAGLIEVELKKHLSDKTNWSKMLSSNQSDIDLKKKKKDLNALMPDEFKQYITLDNRVYSFNYPIDKTFDSYKALLLDKESEIRLTLAGVKGQYLVFDNGASINVRRHNGYLISIEY